MTAAANTEILLIMVSSLFETDGRMHEKYGRKITA